MSRLQRAIMKTRNASKKYKKWAYGRGYEKVHTWWLLYRCSTPYVWGTRQIKMKRERFMLNYTSFVHYILTWPFTRVNNILYTLFITNCFYNQLLVIGFLERWFWLAISCWSDRLLKGLFKFFFSLRWCSPA